MDLLESSSLLVGVVLVFLRILLLLAGDFAVRQEEGMVEVSGEFRRSTLLVLMSTPN